jgi:hypothetical protein
MDEDDVRLVVRVVLEALACLPASTREAWSLPSPAGMQLAASRAVVGSSPAAELRSRRVVTEADVVDATAAGRILVPRGCVVTPLARDTAAERGVELVMEG